MSTLTAHSTIGDWLDHPEGGVAIRAMLAQSGGDAESLTQVRSLPLQQLVELSQGQMPQSVVDDLVRSVNGGEIPEDTDSGAWQERISSGRFDGQTVIVTGAASGIGRATASRIVREGGTVIAVDISADKLEAFAADAPAGRVVPVAGDVTKQESIDAILAAAGGHIDALANIAGVNDDFSPIHETQRRNLGPRHRHQPHRRIQAHPRGRAGHARSRQGRHREHLL